MFATIFREDISVADLRKAGLKNPEQTPRMVRVGRDLLKKDGYPNQNAMVEPNADYVPPKPPKKVKGTKPVNMFDPTD
jgi:hypothetical protein